MKEEEINQLVKFVRSTNTDEMTGIWGRDTLAMSDIISSVGDLLSNWEVAFDHTSINFGKGTRAFKRAPKGTSDVYLTQSSNPKLALTYVLCASKEYGVLPGYYIVPEQYASKAVMKDLQAKGEIHRGIS